MFMDNLLDAVLLGVPEKVANLQLPDPDLRDYYKDEANRIFWLDTDITHLSLDLVRMIIEYNKEDKGKSVEERTPIKIMINSGGGDVQVMLTIIQAIKLSKTPVYTINFCNAMSAAAEILAAGHKRFALPGTCVMVHSGSCYYGGTMEQAESYKKYVDALTKKATDIFLANTKIDSKTLKKKGAADWYFDEEEAVAKGVIDEIISDLDCLF
jgi:ATP-dependent protease ClpP protease subunit